MKNKIKALKRKLDNFIERVTLSESEYLTMKEKIKKFDGMMSKITEIKDKEGNVLYKFSKDKGRTINYSTSEILDALCIIYDKDITELNIE